MNITKDQIEAAKSRLAAAVTALKRQQEGKPLSAKERASIEWAAGDAASFPTYDTMSRCEVATGIPAAILSAAKKNGCPGFEHGRVNLSQFLPWYFGQKAGEFISERNEKLRNLKLDADLKATELAKIEGRLIEPEVMAEEIARCFGLVRQAILSGRAEVPPRANPQDHKTAMEAWHNWESRFFPYVRHGMDKPSPPPFPPPTTEEPKV